MQKSCFATDTHNNGYILDVYIELSMIPGKAEDITDSSELTDIMVSWERILRKFSGVYSQNS